MWSSSVSRPVLASLRTKPPRVNRPGPKAIICEKKTNKNQSLLFSRRTFKLTTEDPPGTRSPMATDVRPMGQSECSLFLANVRVRRIGCGEQLRTSTATPNCFSAATWSGTDATLISMGSSTGSLRGSWLVCRRPRSPNVVFHTISSFPIDVASLAAQVNACFKRNKKINKTHTHPLRETPRPG